MRRSLFATTVLAAAALTACGTADADVTGTAPPTGGSATNGSAMSPSSSTEPPDATSNEGTNAGSAEGGFGDPVWTEAELVGVGDRRFTGTVRLGSDGCWLVELGSERPLLLAVPEGFVSDPADPARLVGPGDVVLTHGTAVDGRGDLVWPNGIAGGDDSRWGDLLSFCDPAAGGIAAFTEIGPSYDPTSVPTDGLVDALRAVTFDTAWPCGYGFAASSPDQRIGLLLYAREQPTAAVTISLPDDRWTATISVGKDLFVQHCDDVIEGFEPIAIVVGEWPIVAGTFELAPADDPGGCGSAEVRTQLTGAIVDTPAGPVELPPIALVNTAWGCFAG